jgi:GT2 family glycosyltransferase
MATVPVKIGRHCPKGNRCSSVAICSVTPVANHLVAILIGCDYGGSPVSVTGVLLMAAIYIILVNWNGQADTIECLESLLRLDHQNFSIVIVDNASTDGSSDSLKSWAKADAGERSSGPIWDKLGARPRKIPSFQSVKLADTPDPAPDGSLITLIEGDRNLGFGAGNNIGLRFAAKDPNARFFWILNNDTVVLSDTLWRLERYANTHLSNAIVGSTLLYYHDPETVQGLGGWSKPARALAGHIGFGLNIDDLSQFGSIEGELAYVMGASMFVRRTFYEEVGGMAEDYFLYFEELDWAKRLPSGWTQGLCKDAIVYHKEGGSIGTDSNARPSDTSIYYFSVNTLRYFWRHERRHLPVAVARLLWNAGHFFRQRDWAGVRVIARAIFDAVTDRRRRGPYDGLEFHSPMAHAS